MLQWASVISMCYQLPFSTLLGHFPVYPVVPSTRNGSKVRSPPLVSGIFCIDPAGIDNRFLLHAIVVRSLKYGIIPGI